MRILDALAQFLVQLDADGRSSHTIAQYKRHVLAFERWLLAEKRDAELATITPEVVAAFFVAPAARCCAQDPTTAKRPTSLNAMRSSLRCFFSYAHDLGLIASNPARRLRRARCGPPPPRALNKDEQDRLIATLASAEGETGRRDHVLFHLLLATGLRVSSALGLRVEDVDLNAGEVWVTTTKGSRPNRVFLSPAIKEHLAQFIGDRRDGWLFPGRDEEPIDRRHAHRRLRDALTKAEITRAAGPHTLRHSFATDLYTRTGDIAIVKEALTHRSIASTLIYARIQEFRVRAAISAGLVRS